ncbi:immune inhibitor A domain-containing protein [Ammoniphilus sp. CFH 90114]|uniref:immune inhibitor A domain-containing protein n=1 Tax=Ammoniphilus sp. CFH 90114 TaxID=2493665 RepID=UPI00100F1CC4|nr:immune inhibitor A domain-containing protein [Ammoniphilus sp. CFH 90114]RXT07015.1 M6 family metalloprotease domain-containing protein [Ammoniphilus sp. CFH 90114]
MGNFPTKSLALAFILLFSLVNHSVAEMEDPSKTRSHHAHHHQEEPSDPEYEKKLRTQTEAIRSIVERMNSQNSQDSPNGMMSFMNIPQLHTDYIALALIEFPDVAHNQLSDPFYRFQTDFSPEHYERMLFNQEGYVTPEGTAITTMAQYFYEQSGGTWTVDGESTPWIQSVHESVYYGENSNSMYDVHDRELVAETLDHVGTMIQGKEHLYDQRDPYDSDGDGDLYEPDGMLDNLMVVYAGESENTLDEPDLIWPKKSHLEGPTRIPGTSLLAYDFTLQSEFSGTGLFAHEYSHNLGLPDLYDTTSFGSRGLIGTPVGAWSLMDEGGRMGMPVETLPTGFDPWSKMFLQTVYGGRWIEPIELDYDQLDSAQPVLLTEATDFDPHGKLLKINLPDQEIERSVQPLGTFSYYTGKENLMSLQLTSDVIDLTPSENVTLHFDSFRWIEEGYDFFTVSVIDEVYREGVEIASFSDRTSDWEHQELDLSAFAGRPIQLHFAYKTDQYVVEEGVFLDEIKVVADGQTIFYDNVESDPKFQNDGFALYDGTGDLFPHYYLIELRSHRGVDQGLQHVYEIEYEPGMLIWYYDGRFKNNRTSLHPGYGMIGVVDARTQVLVYSEEDPTPMGSLTQVRDATFGLKETAPSDYYPTLAGVPIFYDRNDYSIPDLPEAGKILPKLGLQVQVHSIADDYSKMEIEVSKSEQAGSELAYLLPASKYVTLAVGEAHSAVTEAVYFNGSREFVTDQVTYSSSHPEIVSVAGQGIFQAHQAGNAVILASYEGKTAEIHVTVLEEDAPAEPVITSIGLDHPFYQLVVGDTHQAVVTAVYSDGKTEDITARAEFRSLNPSVAEVTADGLITAKSVGSTILQVASGEHQAEAEVAVVIDECFIATAAFGSKFQPEVALLRLFRDQYLLQSSVGKAFVELYYTYSPPIAQFIANSEILKLLVRLVLMPVVTIVYVVMNPVWLLAGMLAWFTWSWRRKIV